MTSTLDLFTYPLVPGAKAGGTSAEAAEAMKPSAGTLRAFCLSLLDAVGSLTADEAAAGLKESPLSIRPRFSELHALGQIIDTGERRLNASGRRAIVWRCSFSADGKAPSRTASNGGA